MPVKKESKDGKKNDVSKILSKKNSFSNYSAKAVISNFVYFIPARKKIAHNLSFNYSIKNRLKSKNVTLFIICGIF